MSIKKFYFDLETGGLDAKKNPIVQMAGVIVIDDKEEGTFNWTMAPFPGQVCEATALEVNGRTQLEVDGFTHPKVIHGNLTRMLEKFVDRYNKQDKFHLIAYNSTFDTEFLRQYFINCQDVYFGSWFWVPDQCIMRDAARVLMGERAKLANFKLGTVAEYLGIDTSSMKLHDALADIRVSMEIEKRVREMERSRMGPLTSFTVSGPTVEHVLDGDLFGGANGTHRTDGTNALFE